ncbi:MAG TPA: aminopeptidase, partial [Candidatus Poseidoniaceae archaeon]
LEAILESVTDPQEQREEGKAAGPSETANLELEASALTVVTTCMDIRRNENVLIVCDPTTAEIGAALHEAAMTRSDRVLLMLMPKGRHHGQEPPTPVATLMRQQQVVIAPTRYSLTHTRAVRTALSDGARIATMPGMTAEMFQGGGMSADFSLVKQRIARLPSRLRRRRIVNVRSEAGTELTFEVAWREWNFDDNGICNRPKMLMNLPAGKVFIMPREGTMNGRLVLNGSWEGTLIEEPVTLEIEQGVIASITGGEMASRIRKGFQDAVEPLRPKDQDGASTIAEFGFGMNPAATLTGSVLEDEKCLGTCYFMFGDNTAGGGTNRVGFTLSGVMRDPSVWLDGEPLLEQGVFVEE